MANVLRRSSLHTLYIEAISKEMQLQNIHAEQAASLAVDAFKKMF
ncbi:hypothetical protein Q648_00868 [Bartonella quintana JK 12]|uniref:Uncharacterized protein n=1 Tax=Bartonella quintana JK 73 TaxID=1402976 RepID=W3U1F5_BARQI|nr:hypothetical protein Q650_00011 [Bartonella quintana JK 73rel]ETS17431.1 hypothetical protein Q649_00011 [Bartonella quintana JK 73]ETS17466.1 hypothetical protein Q648_00868 [Bartonella quintana JK 12]ETS19524.1 hypothetical protein Q647_00011 [Bartonella quintana JK 7]KEC58147.1 hypothetical protein O93_01226 [Bartonella quintana JK 19]KEC69139.1 hypothetical protein O7Q_00084 [Bartonella quintana JK 39]SQF96463.1 Uncharacterised protein [Bartonella quintana]